MASPCDKISWHQETLPSPTRRALDYFSRQPWLARSKWYLAGGTALALQAGHRRSVDLDFFLPNASFSAPALLARLDGKAWKTFTIEEGTVHGALFGAKVSFLSNQLFRPLFPFLRHGHVRVLSERDVAATKIIAISQRGKKRDFVDAYWYCMNREPLESVLRRLPKQYPDVSHDFHHILKSLVYFEDAEGDPMPDMVFPASWRVVKAYFRNEVRELANKLFKS